MARAELRALFPDRGVNGFPYWAVREERRSFFQAFSVGKLGCSLCCHSQGAVCHFPSSPWACDREMDDICSLAALLPKHTHTVCLCFTHTQTPMHAHTHTLSFLHFFPSLFSYCWLLWHTRTECDCLCSTPLYLLPLATKPISYISRGIKIAQVKTMKLFWGKLQDSSAVCLHGVKILYFEITEHTQHNQQRCLLKSAERADAPTSTFNAREFMNCSNCLQRSAGYFINEENCVDVLCKRWLNLHGSAHSSRRFN